MFKYGCPSAPVFDHRNPWVPVIEQVPMTKCSPWQYPEAQSFTFLIKTDSYGLFLKKADSLGKCSQKKLPVVF